jgi:hypothetical protein
MEHEKKYVWVGWAIIIGLFGPVLAFFGPNLVQLLTLKTGDTIFIDTPIKANYVFLAGILLLVLCCVFMYFGKKFLLLSIASFIISVAIIYVSSTHYLMMTKDELIEKPLLGESIVYKWSDVKEGQMMIEDMENGSGKLVLTFHDDYVMEFERNDYMIQNYNAIDTLLRQNGIVYTIKEVSKK